MRHLIKAATIISESRDGSNSGGDPAFAVATMHAGTRVNAGTNLGWCPASRKDVAEADSRAFDDMSHVLNRILGVPSIDRNRGLLTRQ